MTIESQQMDFFKFMDETIKQEESKRKTILAMGKEEPPFNANREYQNRYSHRVYDRFWIGPRRY